MVKVLAGNKCEATSTQRMVDKDRGVKVGVSYSPKFQLQFRQQSFHDICLNIRTDCGEF